MNIPEAIAELEKLQEAHGPQLDLCDERGVSVTFEKDHSVEQGGDIVLVWS